MELTPISAEQILLPFSALRVFATVILPILPALAVCRTAWLPLAFALALLALDMVDSISTLWIPGGLECQPLYQGLDKVVDQLQYAVALALIWQIIPLPILCTIIGLYLWRWVGVLIFLRDGAIGTVAKRWLIMCPDVTKELLVLATILLLMSVTTNSTYALMILMILTVILGKILFEYWRWLGSRKCKKCS